jgi:Sigma-70 region 2
MRRVQRWFAGARDSASGVDWERVYRSELPRVYNFMRYMVRDHEVAEDLTAATFERAWRKRARYTDQANHVVAVLDSQERRAGPLPRAAPPEATLRRRRGHDSRPRSTGRRARDRGPAASPFSPSSRNGDARSSASSSAQG